jgi:CDP-glucose 4,6-dehydratase
MDRAGVSAFGDAYRGKRVLLTGHTGFKGSWLGLWLERLGARTTGLAIDVPTRPSLFELAAVGTSLDHRVGDVRDARAMADLVEEVRPDVVFHLAAQSLVRASYAEPLATLSTNVLGVANMLEAVRIAERPCAVVVVTSDKCYHNDGRRAGYRETDPMGGHDPYSMSKGAAELVVDSWRASYFSGPDSRARLASGRAGNVIGGGDWAVDRIVTDCIAALGAGRAIEIRNPLATRPWQHVLEPLSGYLMLGERLMAGAAVAEGWNFGPDPESTRTVADLVRQLVAEWGAGKAVERPQAGGPKEAFALSLNIDKARDRLGWRPVWDFERTVAETASWYKSWLAGDAPIRELCGRQIESYERDAAEIQLPWAG